MNYYEHWLGDYRKKTGRLRMAEHGAYRLLLDEYYASEEPLPAAYADLFDICGAMKKPDQDAVRLVADRFFPISEDGLRHNDRADEEIEKAQRRIGTSRSNGRKGGRHRNPTGTPPGSHKGPDRNPTGTPEGTRKEPVSNPTETRPGEALPHTPHATRETEPAGVSQPSAAATLPGNLKPDTWASWKSHLAAKGKGLTPQSERLQLVRLGEHLDPEATVQDAIHRGHAQLAPVGGWPSDRERKPVDGALAKLTPAGQRTAENLRDWINGGDEEPKHATA